MIQEITSLQTETIVLLTGLLLVLVNASVAALSAKSHLKQGKRALAAQDINSAVHHFSQEILNHPENAAAYVARAEAYRLNGENKKAVEDERKAEELMSGSTSNQRTDHTLSPSF